MDIQAAGPVVLEALTRACSQDGSVLKPAEQQLKEWETQPGFYSILSTIFMNHEIDVNVRWLAVLLFKNGIDRYWRKSAPHAIPEQEKDGLRKQLISKFDEPISQVATQLSVLIAKVARLDCPRNWPDLIPTLLHAVRCDIELLQQRALLTLHHVTKSLSSKRLAMDRKLFEDLTSEIFSYILGLWNQHLSDFLQCAYHHDDQMTILADRCKLSLKVLRIQVVHGFREPENNPDAVSFIAAIFNNLKSVLNCRQSLWGNHAMLGKCEKLILGLTKVLLGVLEMHPCLYVRFIRDTLQFAVKYTFTGTEQGVLFERFTVNCFNLIKGIVHCDIYRPAKTIEETSNPVTLEAYKLKMEFFTYPMLRDICHRLVTHYFLLNSDDLITWDTDPEQFFQDEGGDSFKYSLRPCTEVLFLSLFKEFRQTLTPVLLEIVNSLQGPCDPDDIEAMLKKEAVYNAVGLSSFDLFDDVDFDSWFTNHLSVELKCHHNNYRIIRRRVVWLIGQWVGVKMSVSMRPSLYTAILPLLQVEEDVVVKLEAARTIKAAVDDFEFDTEQFLPDCLNPSGTQLGYLVAYAKRIQDADMEYLNAIFGLLFQLLKDVMECDTKMHVLHVISFVIERVGSQIRPYAACLIQYLPLLWQDAQDHSMLRCAILTTLVHLAQGLGSECSQMYSFLLPVIQMSTDVTQPAHVYLMEDGLELWRVMLDNSTQINTSLLSLFRNMPALLDLGSENLRVILLIIEAYILLGHKEFMQQYSGILVSSLCGLISDIRPEGIVKVLRVVEVVFLAFPLEGPQLFEPLLPNILKTILQKEEYPMVVSVYLSLFGRIILQNNDFFLTFVERVSAEIAVKSSDLIGNLIDVWIEKLDSITQPERRKLSALAMTSLLTSNISSVMDRFAGIINTCVEVLHDVCRTDTETSHISDSLVYLQLEDLNEDILDTEHDKRKRALSREDPVHTIDLRKYIMSQMTRCQQMLGQATFNAMMEDVDIEIVQQLQEFVK